MEDFFNEENINQDDFARNPDSYRSNINLNVPTSLKLSIKNYAKKSGFTLTQAIVNLLYYALEMKHINIISDDFPYSEDGKRF